MLESQLFCDILSAEVHVDQKQKVAFKSQHLDIKKSGTMCFLMWYSNQIQIQSFIVLRNL